MKIPAALAFEEVCGVAYECDTLMKCDWQSRWAYVVLILSDWGF